MDDIKTELQVRLDTVSMKQRLAREMLAEAEVDLRKLDQEITVALTKRDDGAESGD